MILMLVFVHHTFEKQWPWGLYCMHDKVIICLLFLFHDYVWSTFELGKGKSSKNWGVYQGLQTASLWVEISLAVYFILHTWWTLSRPLLYLIPCLQDRLNHLFGHSPHCSLLPCTHGFLCVPHLTVNSTRLSVTLGELSNRHCSQEIMALLKKK